MTILLTLYLAGMPISMAALIWALRDAPAEDISEAWSLAGAAALIAWVVLWPLFLILILVDELSER